ncbi:YrzI family small protein [Bacillus shivajii]|nr:YrzI family small protein [Bacillus shivajii]UCZ52075.1 YrzI family small protein [Bacillus shivajii]
MVINLLFVTITVTKRKMTNEDVCHAQHEQMKREHQLQMQAKQAEQIRIF